MTFPKRLEMIRLVCGFAKKYMGATMDDNDPEDVVARKVWVDADLLVKEIHGEAMAGVLAEFEKIVVIHTHGIAKFAKHDKLPEFYEWLKARVKGGQER